MLANTAKKISVTKMNLVGLILAGLNLFVCEIVTGDQGRNVNKEES